MGDRLVRKLTTVMPEFSADAEFFPEMDKTWGLSFMINTEQAPTGRAAGSLAWALALLEKSRPWATWLPGNAGRAGCWPMWAP